jgi:sugar lactone lactonase YvrE
LRAIVVFLLLIVGTAHAGGTRSFRVTSYKDFEEGEAHQVVLTSLGEAQTGYTATRVDMSESAAWCMAQAADGTVWIGTGDQGALWSYKGGKAKPVAKLGDAVLVSAVAAGKDGTVYAGTMPGGKIWSVGKDGRQKELAKLDAEHVWALLLDEARGTLYAGTGPAGKLFAIDVKTGKSRMAADTGEKHLMSLVIMDDGSIIAGSADQAILFRLATDGKVTALHDFEGEEVRAIARQGNTLFVAVNEFQKTASVVASSSGPTGPKGTKIVVPSGTSGSSLPGRDRKGKGAIYRFDADGRVEQLHALADGYFTALAAEKDGSLFAAAGMNGRVYLVRPDRTVLTAFDVAERQVLSLAFADPAHRLLGTGDAGALYRASDETPKDATWTSKVFDAQFPAKFGNLRWRGAGALTLQTRSGNTAKPDRTWSAWQAPPRVDKLPDGGVGRIASPGARYLQMKVSFGASRSTLRDAQLFYQPQNQRARVTEVAVGEDSGAKRVSIASRSKTPRSPVVKLRWKVENPDEDELVYRVYYREETETNWKLLGGSDPLTSTSYDWNTEPIPDGNYVVKVVASDERANGKEDALDHSLVSAPFLVDNKKPELADVKVAYPWASGRARDSFSPISELAWSLDGGDWQPLAPRDGVLDDPTEDFSFKLPTNLASGGHSLALRAADSADNLGAVQLQFKVP